ncbi:hypothetical protein KY366_04425 [Candidatus Woesearchaeota archaeon]|nr:hypothetical protein [Candidatus Woesearchaeota archaeon]
MRIKLMLLMLILLVPFATAKVECNKVVVVKFNYDNGVITYMDRVIKCGYAPDRIIQPEEGYTAQVISTENEEVLYSFRFEVPLEINIDLSDPLVKSLSGGMMILNETDFALIFPYYDKAKYIVVYNPRDYEVLKVPLIEEQFIQDRSFWWVIILALLLILGLAVYNIYRKKSRREEQAP